MSCQEEKCKHQRETIKNMKQYLRDKIAETERLEIENQELKRQLMAKEEENDQLRQGVKPVTTQQNYELPSPSAMLEGNWSENLTTEGKGKFNGQIEEMENRLSQLNSFSFPFQLNKADVHIDKNGNFEP